MLELDRTTEADAPAAGTRLWPSILARVVRHSTFVDRLTLAYVGLTSLPLIFSPHDVAGRAQMLAVHAVIVTLIAALAYFRRPQPAGWRTTLNVFSQWYPIALPVYFFEEIHSLVHVVFPQWFDAVLIRFDYATFGAHPTVWFEQYVSYWLTEAMNFAYFAYWPLVPGVAVALWVGERKQERRTQFATFTLALCVAYYLCYVVFILFPVEGPYHTLRHLQRTHEMPGWMFTAAVALVEKHGRIHGGAFPSAHVAGSVVALLVAFRWSRKLGLALTPLVLGVLVSTVYGRYHYAADIWGGVLVGVVGWWWAEKLQRRQARRETPLRRE